MGVAPPGQTAEWKKTGGGLRRTALPQLLGLRRGKAFMFDQSSMKYIELLDSDVTITGIHGQVFEGRLIGICPSPSYVIEGADGLRRNVGEHIVSKIETAEGEDMELTIEERALAAAQSAYDAAMTPRDGDEPRECMWAAVHAVRDIYESQLWTIERGIREAMAQLEGQTPKPNEAYKCLQDALAGYDIVEEGSLTIPWDRSSQGGVETDYDKS